MHKMFAAPAEMFEPILWDTVNVFTPKYGRLRQDISKTRFHQEFSPSHHFQVYPKKWIQKNPKFH